MWNLQSRLAREIRVDGNDLVRSHDVTVLGQRAGNCCSLPM